MLDERAKTSPSRSAKTRGFPLSVFLLSCFQVTAEMRAGGLCSAAAAQRIEADRSGTGGAEKQPDETEQHREVAAVVDRPPSVRRMLREVGDRHLSREDERDRPRNHPKKTQW